VSAASNTWPKKIRVTRLRYFVIHRESSVVAPRGLFPGRCGRGNPQSPSPHTRVTPLPPLSVRASNRAIGFGAPKQLMRPFQLSSVTAPRPRQQCVFLGEGPCLRFLYPKSQEDLLSATLLNPTPTTGECHPTHCPVYPNVSMLPIPPDIQVSQYECPLSTQHPSHPPHSPHHRVPVPATPSTLHPGARHISTDTYSIAFDSIPFCCTLNRSSPANQLIPLHSVPLLPSSAAHGRASR